MQPGASSDFLARLTGILCIATAGAYAVGFNNFSSLRPALSGLLALFVIFSLLVGSLLKLGRVSSIIILIGYLLFMGFAMIWVGTPQDLDALFRYIISLTALLVFTQLPMGDLRGALSLMASVILFYALIVAVTAPSISVAGVARVGAFVGGDEGFHSSAIVVSALAIIIWTSPWRLPAKIAGVTVAAALLIGYGGATEMLMLGVFGILWVSRRRRWPPSVKVGLCIIMILGSILYRDENSVAGGTISQLGAGALGSGRLDAWNERLHVFLSEDLLFKLVGGGAYSDYRVTPLWWWEEKSAHSDLVTLTMEFGLIGLALFLFCLVAIRRTLSDVGLMALTAAFAGMLLSNTLLDRPGLAVFWGFAVYSANQLPRSLDSVRFTLGGVPKEI